MHGIINAQLKNNDPVIHVGITGHRFLSEKEKIEQALDKAYNAIIQHYPTERLTLYSPLAEGADRLAAKVFHNHNAEICVVLPLDVHEYQKDFSYEQSLTEFLTQVDQATEVITLPKQSDHRLAYQYLGQFLIDHSDIMIAVWDGKESHAMGSTGSIVALARKKKKPIIWIHAGNRIAGTQQTISLGADQGKIEFENF